MPTVLITGGSGLVGKQLTTMLLAKKYSVIILSRSKAIENNTASLSYCYWDVNKQVIDKTAIEKADYIIHLAGAGVAEKRWTEERKKEILESRVNSSALLIKALKETNHKVQAIISASAIGWYGENRNNNTFIETDLPATDFLGTTCKLWEESIEEAETLGIRVVKLRTGIVLATNGGAMKEFLKPVKVGIAAILGSGKQIISWIHINDLCNQYIFAIENNAINGSYNAVAPQPVSNKELTLLIAKKLRKSFYLPIHIPVFFLKILLGEMSIEVLKSANVSSKKMEDAGFTFQYKTAEDAVQNLLP